MAPVSARKAQDQRGPQLTALSVERTTFASEGKDAIVITARLVDDSSGVACMVPFESTEPIAASSVAIGRMLPFFAGPQIVLVNAEGKELTVPLSLQQGTSLDGMYSGRFEPMSYVGGDWTLSRLSATDQAGNPLDLDALAIAAAGFGLPAPIVLRHAKGRVDREPPTLLALTVAQPRVRSEQPQKVRIEAQIRDNLAGVGGEALGDAGPLWPLITVSSGREPNRRSQVIALTRTAGDQLEGLYSGELETLAYSDEPWLIDSVALADDAGNGIALSAEQLVERKIHAPEVVGYGGGPVDRQAPLIRALSWTQHDAGYGGVETVVFNASFDDDLSGIAGFWDPSATVDFGAITTAWRTPLLIFETPAGEQSVALYSTGGDQRQATFTGQLDLAPYAGAWRLRAVEVADRLGNTTVLTATSNADQPLQLTPGTTLRHSAGLPADLSPPKITALALEKSTVSSEGGDSIGLSAEFSDDLAGLDVKAVQLTFASDDGQVQVVSLERRFGTARAGRYEGQLTLPPYQGCSWRLVGVEASDLAGNSLWFDQNTIPYAALGLADPIQITQQGPIDQTPPELVDIRFETLPSPIAAQRRIRVRARIRDDLAGIAATSEPQIVLGSGSAQQIVSLQRLEGTALEGAYGADVDLEATIADPWSLEGVIVVDRAGNGLGTELVRPLPQVRALPAGVPDLTSKVTVPLQQGSTAPQLLTAEATDQGLLLTFSEAIQSAGGGGFDSALLRVDVDGHRRSIARVELLDAPVTGLRRGRSLRLALAGQPLASAKAIQLSYASAAVADAQGSITDLDGNPLALFSTSSIDTLRTALSTSKQGIADLYRSLILTGHGPIRGAGNRLDNTLIGNDAANGLDGLAGADRMVGMGGNDTYWVDDPGDSVVEQPAEGRDQVFSCVTYILPGDVESLQLIGRAAIDGCGNDLDNTLIGNKAANVLDGGGGADVMRGDDGGDTYIVDDRRDRVVERSSARAFGRASSPDTVLASVDFTLPEAVEDLVLTGSDPITGIGNRLNNQIRGNGAGNVLSGGPGGRDVLSGGGGADVFRFASPINPREPDRITDFSIADGDRLELVRRPLGLDATTQLSFIAVAGDQALQAALRSAVLVVFDSTTGGVHLNRNGSSPGAGRGGGLLALLEPRSGLEQAQILLVDGLSG